MLYYGMLYSTGRFISEFFRQPDPQLGFVLFGWVTMGQVLSVAMFAIAASLYPYLAKRPRS